MKTARKLIIITLILLIAASIFAPMSVLASNSRIAFGAATANVDGLRLRSGPGLNHSITTLLSEGDIVVVLERTSKEWFRVNFHGTVGFVSAPLLRDVLTAENFNAQGRVTGIKVNLRARPNTTSDILTSYSEGTTLTVVGINNGWYKIQNAGLVGYIRSDLMEIVPGQKPAASTRVTATGTHPTNPELGHKIANFALEQLGLDYVWGGASPSGFDCSGLVSYVYKNFGISVTRNASGQYRDNGVLVAREDLALGDLVFFSKNGSTITHVGIYIGDNEFVHASRPGVGVVISRLDSSTYHGRWFGAKRLI